MSLFPTTRRNNHLVQFNAGKCIVEGNLVKPDTRKGVIYMDQSDDQLMHFCWKERKSSSAEDDYIIFPDEAELAPVSECTTGRVFVLKFKSSGRTLFYWMQSKSDEKDQELVSRVNQLINDPSSANNESSSSNTHRESADLMRMLSEGQGDLDLSQDNFLQFVHNAGGLSSSALPSANVVSTSKWTDVKIKLSEMTLSEEQETLDLGHVLNKDILNPIFADTIIRSALFPFVSQARERTSEEIEEIVASDRFKQRIQLINKSIQQNAFASIINSLEAENNVESFLKAASEQAKRRKSRGETEDMEED